MAAMSQSILYHNQSRSVILIDGPKSIEDAQFLDPVRASDSGNRRRLISSKPLQEPFKTPEPKQDSPDPDIGAALANLLAAAAADEALQVLRGSYSGPWCLPRVHAVEDKKAGGLEAGSRKRKAEDMDAQPDGGQDNRSDPLIAEESVHLQGTISSQRSRFLEEAPIFDLIVMDPPWPNRSVRRKSGSYRTANSLEEIRRTLSLIPIASRLAPGGLVAVWITNKPSVLELMQSPTGLFAEWGLEPVSDWTWLKVTTCGEPMVGVASSWRKPWERLLIAKKRGAEGPRLPRPGRVIVSVPDLHSRKPNLRPVFEDILPPRYKGLEIFARSLTAGWWSWGDEVLEFQQPEHWVKQ